VTKTTPGRTELVVGAGEEARLDVLVGERLRISRSRAARLIEEGRVTVNGSLPRKRDHPAAGDRVVVEVPPLEPSPLAPEDIPLDIAYEDADLLVVNKPSGMVVHPAPGHRSGTLVNALLYRLDDLSGIGGVLRPGIVHRLDRDTSGLMLVAKHDGAHRALSAALKAREVRREYIAACWGHLPEDRMTVDAPIGRNPRDRMRMAVVESGRLARTRFRRDERWVAADLLRVRLDTGRTHQIRVHLLHVGHPVVGDPIYAEGRERGFSGYTRAWARELARRTPRLFLHATELRFTHPANGRDMRLEAPLPADLAAVADWARETAG